MKLCITATGKNIDANTDARFGRAPWFLIIDTDTGAILEAIENTASAQPQGAGIAAAKLVSDKNVDAILTGSVGPNATSVFQTAGVNLIEGVSSQDTVQEALAKFKQGAYDQAGASTTPSPQSGVKRGRGIAGGGRGMGGGGIGRGIAGGGRGMGGGGRGRGIAGGGRGMGGGGGQGMGGGSGQR